MDSDLYDFLTHLTKERGSSPSTLESYRTALRQWLDYLARQQRTPREVQAGDFAAWLKTLWAKVPSPATVSRNVTALKLFYRFLAREDRLPDGKGILKEVENLTYPRRHRKLPEVLSVAEVEALLAAPRPGDSGFERSAAILEYLYSSGCRVRELIDTTLANVHLAEGFARVMGKGRRERVVPIGRKCVEALERWLAVRDAFIPRGKEAPWLFVNRMGQQVSRLHLNYLVKICARQAGIRRPVAPHMLRKSFASHQLENGADISFIKMMLGHQSLSSTEIYLGVAVGKLQELHARCHPLGGQEQGEREWKCAG